MADSRRGRQPEGGTLKLHLRFAQRALCVKDAPAPETSSSPLTSTGPPAGGQVQPNGPLAGVEGVGNEEDTRSIAYWSPSQ